MRGSRSVPGSHFVRYWESIILVAGKATEKATAKGRVLESLGNSKLSSSFLNPGFNQQRFT